MKRLSIVLVILFFIALGFSSCKSHERCPAYSHNSVETSLTKTLDTKAV